jgi:4-hydroxythreonine-4-phosphate dehydrogenase
MYLRPLSNLTDADIEFGRPSREAGDAVYRYIKEAVGLCLSGEASAMATAPISKEALNRAGHKYPGHTELLAELTGTGEFVMMLAGDKLRVSLVTIHEALAAVPGLVTFDRVLSTIRITNRDLHRYFKKNPRLAVLALNPHCGEGGLFGREEECVIKPAVDAARKEGVDAVGPLSADTLFHFAADGKYDAVVCMYHDQGLIPLKMLAFGNAVNVTLNLPIVRTSVDHGTAHDIAGQGIADIGSYLVAVELASQIAHNRLTGHG